MPSTHFTTATGLSTKRGFAGAPFPGLPLPLLGDLRHLDEVVHQHGIRRVIVAFGPTREADLVLLAPDGDEVAVHTGGEPAEVLVLAGLPLREPVARYGPFVMNTREEIIEAFEDYQAGRMGRITV